MGMKKFFFTLFVFVFGIIDNNVVFSAPKKSSRKLRSSSVKNVSGKLNKNTFTGTVKTDYTINSSDTVSCGGVFVPNAQAERLCASAIVDALKIYCKDYSCQSKAKVDFSFSFDLPNLSGISADVGGVSCSGKNLNTFCLPFQSKLLDKLWDFYSEQSIRDRKNCNMAMAKYSAAQDCYQYIISEKNQSVDAVFNSSKITNFDKGIDERCGRDAILKKYKSIAVDDLENNEINAYFSSAVLNKDGTISSSGDEFKGKKKLSSNVASLFANVGDNTWNLVGQIGKLADLNLSMKSSTYPREIVVIANTFVTDGETACGKDFASDMEKTSFEIADSRSALEREIAKKGLLKGAFDFTLDNTVGLVSEDKADELKKKGIVTSIKEAVDKSKEEKSNKDVYLTASDDLKKLNGILSSCDGSGKASFADVKTVLQNIKGAVDEIEKNPKYQDALFEKNKDNIIKNLNVMLSLNRMPKKRDIKLSDSSTFSNVKDALAELSSATKFNCPGVLFEEDESLVYKFDFSTGSVSDIIGALIDSRKNFVKVYESLTGENKNDFEDYKKILEQMKEKTLEK